MMTPEIVLSIFQHSSSIVDTALALQFAVSLKTIRRIKRGETYSHITGVAPAKSTEKPVKVNPIDPVSRCLAEKDLAEEPFIRNVFGFTSDLSIPLAWGMFDGWDGLKYVATDGSIAWLHEGLCRYVQVLDGEELPTFGASKILGRSVGETVKAKLFWQHSAVAKLGGFTVKEAVGAKNRYVYLCKEENGFDIIHAAVPTLS